MNRFFNFCLFFIFSFLSFSSTIMARDLGGEEPNDSNFLPQTNFVQDSVPSHLINWPLFHGVHSTGEIKASFSCFGVFGFNFASAAYDYPDSPAVSFVTPAESGIEYLYGGALWIGGIVEGDTLVTVGHDGWSGIREFSATVFGQSPSRGTVVPVEYIADVSYRSEFNDTLISIPLYLKVSNRSFAWHSDPENGTIIYDIVVTNIGAKIIEEGRIGLLMDADIGLKPEVSYADDLAGSIKEKGIAYILDYDADYREPENYYAPKAFAGKFTASSFAATDSIFAWWLSNGNPDKDYGPRLLGTSEHPLRDFGTGGTGTPNGDKNKYYVMSFNEWDYDQILIGNTDSLDSIWTPPPDDIFLRWGDARFLLTLGPFTLKPDSSIRVLYATFTGDSVHVSNSIVSDDLSSPPVYNFDDVLANAALSDSLSQLLLDPNLPPLGLQFVRNSIGEPELQWDSWAFDDVSGYDLFIEAADLSQLPKPGAIPPWWEPSLSEPSNSVEPTHKLNIEYLDPNTIYLAQIAHSHSAGRGELGAPITFRVIPRTAAPQTYSNYALTTVGQPITLRWNSADKNSIDHYNIYKFPDSTGAADAYHIFYDQGYNAQFNPATDSILFDGKFYYYYAMEPFAVVPPGDSEFIDPAFIDSGAYIITSVDEFGFESEFTDPIVSYIVPEMNREILLLTHSLFPSFFGYTYMDSILSYYNSLLNGHDYEIYDFHDSVRFLQCSPPSIECIDWRPFLRFKVIIIDDLLNEFMLQTSSKKLDIFSRFLAYGGKILYFGKFDKIYNGMAIIDGQPQYHASLIDFFGDIFGIKKMFASGPRFYQFNSSIPYVDTLFGFTRAQQIAGSLPSLNLDTTRDPFKPRLREIWPMVTPPGVATFIPEEGVVATHHFHSIHPNKSLQQEHIVGLRKDWPGLQTQTYTFGFHLWYMDSSDARALIEAILSESGASLESKTTIEPSIYHIKEADVIVSDTSVIYLGNIGGGIGVNQIDTERLRVNRTILPYYTELLTSHPDFEGNVLKLNVSRAEFLSGYKPVWDTLSATFSVSGALTDERTLRASGFITIKGRLRGDSNRDGTVNVADLTLLVDFLFRSGQLPEPLELSDVNNDGSVNILDLTKLVDYIFRGKPL